MTEFEDEVATKVRSAGVDKWGRKCWKFGESGRRYCGKNGRQRALRQGFAILAPLRGTTSIKPKE